MRKLYTFALALLAACAFSAPVLAEGEGATCDNPFVWQDGFLVELTEAGSYWLTIQSNQIPMQLQFEAKDEQDVPRAIMDLGCDGNYPEAIEGLVMLAQMQDPTFQLPVPVVLNFRSKAEEEGTYVLNVESQKLQSLLSALPEPIAIIINIETHGAGVLTAVRKRPDPEPENPGTDPEVPLTCEEKAIVVAEEMTILLDRADTALYLPLSEWDADYLVLEWGSVENENTFVWLALDCDFQPSWDSEELQDAQELMDGEVLQRFSIADMVSWYGDALYARFGTEDGRHVEGVLRIGFAFEEGPMAETVQLKYGQSVDVPVEGVNQVYYFRTDWKEEALMLRADAQQVTMHVGTTPDFQIEATDGTYLQSFTFLPDITGSYLSLAKRQLRELAALCDLGRVFVRLESDQAFTLTPYKVWTKTAQICLSDSYELLPTDVLQLEHVEKSVAFRLDLAQWSRHDVLFEWSSIGDLGIYVDPVCNFGLDKADILYSAHLPLLDAQSLPTIKSFVLTTSQMQEWANHVDADGYLYVRFSTLGVGTLTCSLYEPDETPTSLDTPAEAPSCRLVLRNGLLYLDIDGRLYDLLGR